MTLKWSYQFPIVWIDGSIVMVVYADEAAIGLIKAETARKITSAVYVATHVGFL